MSPNVDESNRNKLLRQDAQENEDREMILGDHVTAAQELGKTVAMYHEQISVTTDDIVRSLIIAKASEQLRKMLDPMWPLIENLRGKPYGFVTDRDKPDKHGNQKPPYNKNECLDCLVVALIQGAQPSGNQFNILVGNCYITQKGMEAAVLRFPGLSDWDHEIGTAPEKHGDVMMVKAWAKWKLNGVQQGISYGGKVIEGVPPRPAIPVRQNAGMGIEGVLGKAKRKLFARVLEKLTGQAPLTIDEQGMADEPLTIEGATVEGAKSLPDQPVNRFVSIDQINALEEVVKVNEYEQNCADLVNAAYKEGQLGEAEVPPIINSLTAACNARRKEIRATRGERSNSEGSKQDD